MTICVQQRSHGTPNRKEIILQIMIIKTQTKLFLSIIARKTALTHGLVHSYKDQCKNYKFWIKDYIEKASLDCQIDTLYELYDTFSFLKTTSGIPPSQSLAFL